MRTLSDEALLTGLGSGDPDAAAAFVDRFQRRVSELDKTPVGTVKTRIRTALMRLRSQLGVRDER